MEGGRRQSSQRGCEGKGVHAGSFQGHLPERGRQGRWDSSDSLCSEVLNTLREGLVLGARKHSTTGYRSSLSLMEEGTSKVLGLKPSVVQASTLARVNAT